MKLTVAGLIFSTICCAQPASIEAGTTDEANLAIGGIIYSIPITPPGSNAVMRYPKYPDKSFKYVIPGSNLPLIVTFTFIEPNVNIVGGRLFNVTINDQQVLTNVDIFKNVGMWTPMTRSVLIQGSVIISIQFDSIVRNSIVSKIEFQPLFHFPTPAGFPVGRIRLCKPVSDPTTQPVFVWDCKGMELASIWNPDGTFRGDFLMIRASIEIINNPKWTDPPLFPPLK